jgi:hypothetical protein
MNTYDDIQQFKSKINSSEVNYKEFLSEERTLMPHRWSIVKQVAENCASLTTDHQAAPVPVNATFFFQKPPAGLQPTSLPPAAFVVVKEHAQSARPFFRDFEHLAPPVTPNFTSTPGAQSSRAPSAQSHHVDPPVAEMTPAPPGSNTRFKHMFGKKPAPVDEVELSSCKALLKPLLESIASCR